MSVHRVTARLAACALLAVSTAPAAGPATLALKSGAIYTVDAARSWAQAVAIADGRIVYAGPDSGLAPFAGPHTRVIDLAGRMVLPGFHDSHVHPIQGGRALALCDLSGAESANQALTIVAAYARAHPGAGWLTGSGWQLPLFPNANPGKALLDRIVPDRPAYLESADGHSAWVNSRALALAGLLRSTPDPTNGHIERDASGAPSGTLRESAMKLVAAKIPARTPGENAADLARGLREANRFGITSMQEADADDAMLATYFAADQRGELTARIVAAMHLSAHPGDAEIAALAAKRTRYRGRRFRATSVKIFADGVIEPGTAALLAPYVGRLSAHGSGVLNYDPERLGRIVTELDRAGFQVHIHAIGDRAVRVSLDAHEAARNALGDRDLRPQIAHLELVDPADIPRFRALGVIADFQGFWHWADSYITELTEPVLGRERSRWLYPLASVARTGAMIAGGSDWPVSSLNPLDAIQVACTRRGVDRPEGPAWIPEERATLPLMIAAYTITGAWVNHEETIDGSIEVGKAADLVVLDRNLFAIRPEQIHRTKVVLTLLEGQAVYSDGTLMAEK